jgi:hypothetical protein
LLGDSLPIIFEFRKMGNSTAREMRANASVTKDIWGLGHRGAYVLRLKVAGLQVVKGPYQLDRFWAQEIPHKNRTTDWPAPYSDQLRELARKTHKKRLSGVVM